MLLIKKAKIENSKEVIDFFNKYLDKNENMYSCEFLCPFGVKGAINRNQIIIAVDNEKIVGALRFYKRKKENATSLYQFAVGKKYRGKQLIKKMLNTLNTKKVISQCPKNIKLNNYYVKTGWTLKKENKEFNFWTLERQDL